MAEEKSGGQLFFETARQFGIEYVFGNPGTTEVNFMDALSQADMQFLLCLHEDIATGAADGYARISSKPAIVNVHLMPGLTNGMANIHNAKRARTPMIVTVGDHHTLYGLEDSALAGDIVGVAKGACKWAYSVNNPEEIPRALHRAALKALTPPFGPVCLALPNNVLSQKASGNIEIPKLNVPKPGIAHPEAIDDAIKLLKKAEKPLIVVGDINSRTARQAVLRIAEHIGAKVWRDSTQIRQDPATDPLLVSSENRLPYLPHQRREVLDKYDCIMLLGVSNFTGLFMYDNDPIPELISHNTPVIHAESDLGELGKNAKNAVPLLGDVPLTILTMQERMGITATPVEDQIASNPPAFIPDDNAPLTPAVLGQALRTVVPTGTILVDEAITSGQGIASTFINGNRNLAYILGGRGGALGYGLPASIGASLASPGTPVLAISGDGTAVYVIQYLWTVAHYKLPVVSVICSNRNYDIITLEMMRAQGKLAEGGVPKILQYTGITNPEINFAQVAEGFGVKGYHITKASQLVPALKEAFSSGAPALLDVDIITPFRTTK